MFTGIVQGCRPVAAMERGGGLTRLKVDLDDLADGLALGASVALNGTCVTATHLEGTVATFDLVSETTTLTNLGALAAGERVNVERSLRVGDEVGGHILSGHIACTVSVCTVAEAGGQRRVTVAVPAPWLKYIMPKGFIALDGASLTIADLDRSAASVTVSLIPETLKRTGLGRVAVGHRLNLEVDSRTQAIVDTVGTMLHDRALLRELLA